MIREIDTKESLVRNYKSCLAGQETTDVQRKEKIVGEIDKDSLCKGNIKKKKEDEEEQEVKKNCWLAKNEKKYEQKKN